MPEVANSIERKNKAIKIQDGEILFDAAVCFGVKCSRENHSCGILANKGKKFCILSPSLLRKYSSSQKNKGNIAIYGCNMKDRKTLHMTSQNKVADSHSLGYSANLLLHQ